MSQSHFIKSIQLNEREFRKVEKIRELRKARRASGKDVVIPPQKHTFMTKISVIYDETNPDFKVSNKPKPEGYGQASLEGHKAAGTKVYTYSERVIQKTGKHFVFTWWGLYKKDMKPSERGRVNDDLVEKARIHLRDMRTPEFVKDVKGGKRENYVGGHVEGSAFLELLRKLAATKAIPLEDVTRLQVAYQTGGMAAVENLLNQMIGKAGTTAGPGAGTGFVDLYSSDFGVTYQQLTDIAEATGIDMDINSEIMTPIPADANKRQATQFENVAATLVKRKLEIWAKKNLSLEAKGTGSPNIGEMTAEILAAAMQGKKVPKYKSNYNKKVSKAKSSRQRALVKKGKRRGGTVSKAALIRAKNQLRTTKGKFSSPISLMIMLNKRLPATIRDNMGHPALQNVSGRLANSVRVEKVNPVLGRNKRSTIQYSYDTDPYQVFETGGRGDSRWATAARDPRVLIDKSIREIAAETMMTKFVTQRL